MVNQLDFSPNARLLVKFSAVQNGPNGRWELNFWCTDLFAKPDPSTEYLQQWFDVRDWNWESYMVVKMRAKHVLALMHRIVLSYSATSAESDRRSMEKVEPGVKEALSESYSQVPPAWVSGDAMSPGENLNIQLVAFIVSSNSSARLSGVLDLPVAPAQAKDAEPLLSYLNEYLGVFEPGVYGPEGKPKRGFVLPRLAGLLDDLMKHIWPVRNYHRVVQIPSQAIMWDFLTKPPECPPLSFEATPPAAEQPGDKSAAAECSHGRDNAISTS